MTVRWAVEWYSRNRLDGEARHFLWDGRNPLLFVTRREARGYIRKEYGYIARRRDLRIEPHGWRIPKATKVSVELRRL